DALGNTRTDSIDTNGNLISSVSPDGVASSYKYDPQKNLAGAQLGQIISRLGYDTSGYINSSTTPETATTAFAHDANGNPTGSTLSWVNPQNSADVRVVTTQASFDAN